MPATLFPAHKAIIREIRRLHLRRAPLNLPAVKRSHPKLVERVYAIRPFWGWKRALADADLDYTKINVELRDYVTCKICGQDLGALGVHLHKKHNVDPADYRLEYPEAEITSETTRSKQSLGKSRGRNVLPKWEALWTPEYVLDRIAELQGQGFPLNSHWVGNNEKALLGRAIFYFGSWDEALRRSHLNPSQIRLLAPGEHVPQDQVIARLQERSRQGLPLNDVAVMKADLQLLNAARRRFGSYEKALLAAGFDPNAVRKKPRRYLPKAVAAFMEEARRIAALRPEEQEQLWPAFHRRNQKLVTVCFGGWKRVSAQIGVPVGRMMGRRFPDRDSVLEALEQRIARQQSIWGYRLFDEDRLLYTYVLKHIGSFALVYRHFGIEPPKGRKSRWLRADEAAILAEIRRRERTLEPLLADRIAHSKLGTALLARATTLFGSWGDALFAAGIDREQLGEPKRAAESVYPDKAAVLAAMRGLAAKPRFSVNRRLCRRASTLFGSWQKALDALALAEAQRNLFPFPWSPLYRNGSDLIDALRERFYRGQEVDKLDRRKLHKKPAGRLREACVAYFGSWAKACRAARRRSAATVNAAGSPRQRDHE